MRPAERAGLALLRRVDPERAHELALRAVSMGLGPRTGAVTSDRLATRMAGLDLANPVGLAAGFDKNATSPRALGRAGFGWLEFGAATPRPQTGNARPRLFRLAEDHAAINRFGFNNDGADAIAARLAAAPTPVPRGINLGANKDSPDRAGDYATLLRTFAPHVDFATVNVSSPNTERLRDLQGPEALAALLDGVQRANVTHLPILLKIAPDLEDRALADLAVVARGGGAAAIVATNTTLSRDGLSSAHRGESGGLSGRPLFNRSTRLLARLAGQTDLPLIGVGGIETAETAYAKIRAGASALQLYTAMVYGGLGLVGEIARGLDTFLARDGFANVAEAVGIDRGDWL